MILFEVDIDRVFSVPTKRYAPWAVDMYGVALGAYVQRMKIETGNINFRQADGRFDTVQSPQRALFQRGQDTSRISRLKKLVQSLMSPISNHDG
jgi:hypothetical protein